MRGTAGNYRTRIITGLLADRLSLHPKLGICHRCLLFFPHRRDHARISLLRNVTKLQSSPSGNIIIRMQNTTNLPTSHNAEHSPYAQSEQTGLSLQPYSELRSKFPTPRDLGVLAQPTGLRMTTAQVFLSIEVCYPAEDDMHGI